MSSHDQPRAMQLWLREYPDELWTFRRSALSGGYPVYQGVFICPTCLEIWGKTTWVHSPRPTWEIRAIPCRVHCESQHPYLRPVPGSILDNSTCAGWDYEMLRNLDPQLVEREWRLHFQHESWLTTERIDHLKEYHAA